MDVLSATRPQQSGFYEYDILPDYFELYDVATLEKQTMENTKDFYHGDHGVDTEATERLNI